MTGRSASATDGAPPAPDREDRVPVLARLAALALVGALLVFGFQAIEQWPFTGWRLYSNIKGPTAGSFFAFRLAPDGTEHRIDYQRIPDAYRRAPYMLEKFDRFDESEREGVCRALAQAERGEGRPVAAILIYWERYRVRIVDGERRKHRFERDLRWSCAEAGRRA